MTILPGTAARKKAEVAKLIGAGDVARDARDWRAAIVGYAAALKINPRLAGIWVQLGHAHKESGDLEGASGAYETALGLEPDTADTYLQIGHLRKLQNRVPQAVDAYTRAAEIDPSLRYALDELRSLAIKGVEIDTGRLAGITAASSRGEDDAPVATVDITQLLQSALARAGQLASGDPAMATLAESLRKGVEAAQALAEIDSERFAGQSVSLVFDISDLVGYFNNARLPTGIQRVQIEVISALLIAPQPGIQVTVCTFSQARDYWTVVNERLFLRLGKLALVSGDTNDHTWKAAIEDLKTAIDLGAPATFTRGAYLINLGTSWWLQNYFLQVRQAKELYGIHYIPFVHDMIPIMTPEHCTKPLTQDFISWALGAFAHADHFLTNSRASRKDLIAVARTLGYDLDETNVHVVELNADFRKPETAVPRQQTMARYGLKEGQYALFVSTIESRKNHLNTFKAWLELIQKHGAARVPKLVCVGNRGWLNDEVFAKLDSSPELRSHVIMLSGVSDPDLANLYRACAFTVYPSTYEGWGLPVTESLCYGRPVLLSDASSLPEAGGEFGVYFKLGDQADFVAKLERLMFDLPYRQDLETHIQTEFKPRPWASLGVEIAEQIATWFARDGEAGSAVVAEADLGRYYWLRRVNETAIHAGMTAPEIFRAGDGWWQPDDWGTWTKGKASAMKIGVSRAQGPVRLFLGLQGLGGVETDFNITVQGQTVRSGHLRDSESRWVSVVVPEAARSEGLLHVVIHSAAVQDFALFTGGVDTRIASIGLRGFMVCEDADVASRTDLLEAITLQQLEDLADNWAPRAQ